MIRRPVLLCAALGGLALLAVPGQAQAAPRITINVPVELHNLDATIDHFWIQCELRTMTPATGREERWGGVDNKVQLAPDAAGNYVGTVPVVIESYDPPPPNLSSVICRLSFRSGTVTLAPQAAGVGLAPDTVKAAAGTPFAVTVTLPLTN